MHDREWDEVNRARNAQNSDELTRAKYRLWHKQAMDAHAAFYKLRMDDLEAKRRELEQQSHFPKRTEDKQKSLSNGFNASLGEDRKSFISDGNAAAIGITIGALFTISLIIQGVQLAGDGINHLATKVGIIEPGYSLFSDKKHPVSQEVIGTSRSGEKVIMGTGPAYAPPARTYAPAPQLTREFSQQNKPRPAPEPPVENNRPRQKTNGNNPVQGSAQDRGFTPWQ